MSDPCADYLGCSTYAESMKTGLVSCSECGVNVSAVTRAADQGVDALVSRVDHVTVEHFFDLLADAGDTYAEAMTSLGFSSVTRGEGVFAITVRAFQIISDLREAISKHG